MEYKYPYPTKKVNLNDGIQIAYVDEGQGDHTLLMIHGLGSYIPAWQKNIALLKDHFRCIALDLPNYGKSTKGTFPFTMDFFAETIIAFIEKLELEHISLVGHSMGAQIAVTACLKSSANFEKLVLIAPAGFETFSQAEKAFFYKTITPESIRSMSVDQIRRNFALNFHDNQLPTDALFMFEDRLAMRADPKAYASHYQMVPQCVRGMLEAPIFNELPGIDIPTLIIYGQEDLLIPNRSLHPDEDIKTIGLSGQKQIPGSRLELLSPCGHFVQWECPERVNTLILGFYGIHTL